MRLSWQEPRGSRPVRVRTWIWLPGSWDEAAKRRNRDAVETLSPASVVLVLVLGASWLAVPRGGDGLHASPEPDGTSDGIPDNLQFTIAPQEPPSSFEEAADVAVGPDGAIYVADTGNHRIQGFAPDGQLHSPTGIAAAPDGTLWVADGASGARLRRFAPDGREIAWWHADLGVDLVDVPLGPWLDLAVSPNGDVYLAQERLIARFDPDGRHVGHWEVGSCTELGDYWRSGRVITVCDWAGALDVGPDGTVYVADNGWETRGVRLFESDGAEIELLSSTVAGLGYGIPYYRGVAAAPDGSIALLERDRVGRYATSGERQRLASWGNVPDVRADGVIYDAEGVAVGEDATLLVSEPTIRRIQRFTADGVYLGRLATGADGDAAYKPNTPRGIDTVGDGSVLVAELARVVRVDVDGEVLTSFGQPGRTGSGGEKGDLTYPSDVALAADGSVYIVDPGLDRLSRFGIDGDMLGSWGTTEGYPGPELGLLLNPGGVAAAADGTVYVADTDHHRIVAAGPDGITGTGWGTEGTGEGELRRPVGIAVSGEGTVFVSDAGNGRIQVFDSDGGFRGDWHVEAPVGMDVTAAGALYVATGDGVAVYGVGAPGGWRVEQFAGEWLASAPITVTSTADWAWTFGPASGSPGSVDSVD